MTKRKPMPETNVAKVKRVLSESGGYMRVAHIVELTGLNTMQVWAALHPSLKSGEVLSAECDHRGVKGGPEKYFWLGGLDHGALPEDVVKNIPMVELALRRYAGQAGNPFAGLMA